MSSYEELGALMDRSAKGHREITDLILVEEVLDQFSFGPAWPAGSIRLADCRFERCRVSPGEAVIREGVVLERILFDSLSSHDSLTISTSAALIEVTFTGSSPQGGLWIRPDEVANPETESRLQKWVTATTDEVDWMVDVSSFEAPHLEILGLPCDKVVWNPKKHVLIEAAWRQHPKWVELDLGPTSFWKMRLRRLKSFGVSSGIFALPPSSDRRHKAICRELSRIAESGLLGGPPR